MRQQEFNSFDGTAVAKAVCWDNNKNWSEMGKIVISIMQSCDVNFIKQLLQGFILGLEFWGHANNESFGSWLHTVWGPTELPREKNLQRNI